MPVEIKDYKVQSPDGTVIAFRGPSDMTDEQKILRAQQEYAVQTGKIPTTFSQGARQSAGETLADQSKPLSAAIGLTGVVTGQPEVVAAAPLVGRAIQAGGEALSGRPITPTSMPEVATLGAEGLFAAYGPQYVSKGLDTLASKTVAHQLANGQWVAGIKGSGVMPWAIRTAGEFANTGSNALHSASQAIAAVPSIMGLSQSGDALQADLGTLRDAIHAGATPTQAAAQLAKGDPSRFAQLVTAYSQSLRQGLQLPTTQPQNQNDPSWYRSDGTKKGNGFLGVIQRPDGKVSSEISIGVNIGGKEVEIPTLVPTLSEQEKSWLITNDVSDPHKIPMSIQQKAVDFAKQRIAAGKSPFAQPGEGR